MNKKLSYIASMLLVVLMTTACTSEDELIANGDELNVTFSAVLDQYIDSRAISDGSMVDKLIFIAYDENGNEIAPLHLCLLGTEQQLHGLQIRRRLQVAECGLQRSRQ